MESPRPQAGGQEPAPRDTVIATSPAPGAAVGRQRVATPRHIPITPPPDRDNADLDAALAAFQRALDPPEPW